MTAIATLTQAEGFTKDVFGKVMDARPDCIRVLDYLGPIEEGNKLGEQLSETVWLSDEHGVSYNTSASQGFTLNESVVAETQELNLSGGEIVVRSKTAYKLFSTAVNQGKAAFGSYYKQKIANMRATHMKRLEIQALHGGRSIAQLSAVSGSSTTRTFTISAATWAPWIWAGAKNMWLDAYNSTTLLNDSATDGTEAIIVTSVNFASRQVSVSGESSDLTAVDGAGTSTELYLYGSYGNERTGLIGAASNSGTYAGIDGSSYDLWAGNSYAVSSTNLTWDKLMAGNELAASKGLDEDAVLFVSLPTWNTMAADIMSLRSIDSGYKVGEAKVGHRAIMFEGITGGVEIVKTGIMKGGEAVLLPKSRLRMIGSTNPTFKLPGFDEDRIWRYVADKAAVELQSYSDCAPLLDAPSKAVLFTGIVNT